jgi:hypothetical protein
METSVVLFQDKPLTDSLYVTFATLEGGRRATGQESADLQGDVSPLSF